MKIWASVAAATFCALSGSNSLADGNRDIDVAGIKLGGSIEQAAGAIDKLEGSDVHDFVGTLRLGQFTSSALKFGTGGTVGAALANPLYVTYDLREPHNVVGILRNQLFLEGEMPTPVYIHEALISKYGKPLWDSELAPNRSASMLWGFGVARKFGGTGPLQYADCTRLLAQVVGGNSYSTGNYKFPLHDEASTCGTWIQVFYSPARNNPGLVHQLDVTVADLPKAKLSYDYIHKILEDGDKAEQDSQQKGAEGVRPKL